ncbi:MAG TPA: carboxypeptidase-like regulatory domain-containing protein [Pyrinomonadaceae bacterium]|jgi:hypothetical protein
MRNTFRVSLTLLIISALCGAGTSSALAGGGSRTLGTITGTVRDNRGNPLAGAVISLVKEGAGEIVKQTRSSADGTFSARIAPGRYALRAVAEGFNEALFNAVQVRASDEIVYRFNLEPAGSGRTAPEKRRDRDDVRWRLKAAQGRRSILQIQQGDEDAVLAALGIRLGDDGADAAQATDSQAEAVNDGPEEARTGRGTRLQGVFETYAAASNSAAAPAYLGTNFAFNAPAGRRLDFLFAGQLGAGRGAPQRFETSARFQATDRHRLGLSFGAGRVGVSTKGKGEAAFATLGQLSVRAIDEWVVRDSIVVVLGLDYSRFVGASSAGSVTPRLGLQFDANARTRIKAAFAPGGAEKSAQSLVSFEGNEVVFRQPEQGPVALVGGRAVMERSRRFELGVERVLGNDSNVEATAFFDTTSNRGVGILSTPLSAFAGGASSEAFINVANQQGEARGMRVVYSHRINHILDVSAGYSFGRGQRLSAEGITNPAALFQNRFFQTAALQMGADFGTGTRIRTVFRFSPKATVFAIDPFAGRLAVYDPSLSIMVTQELPTFGLPLRAEAVIDARNILDKQPGADDGQTLLQVNSTQRRSVRGGISFRF